MAILMRTWPLTSPGPVARDRARCQGTRVPLAKDWRPHMDVRAGLSECDQAAPGMAARVFDNSTGIPHVRDAHKETPNRLRTNWVFKN